MTKLADVQQALKVPKDQTNKFGGYKYRTCGAILEAAKPHMPDATVTLSDEIVQVGDRFYIKATATFVGEDTVSVTALAREPLNKKGMDEPQITGTASTYARKVALGGLFAIDDSAEDPDATNDHGKRPSATDILGDACTKYAAITGQDLGAVKKTVWEEVKGKGDDYILAKARELNEYVASYGRPS